MGAPVGIATLPSQIALISTPVRATLIVQRGEAHTPAPPALFLLIVTSQQFQQQLQQL